jgi:tetratricopeptide (TPR) repeat protein
MMKKHVFTLLPILVLLSPKLVWSQVKANVALEGETLNFELLGQKNWDYDLKRVKLGKQTKVQLFVKTIDKAAIEDLKNVKNPFVDSITISDQPVDNKWLVEFVLKSDRVETFDYLTDQPSKLIVDFYASDAAIAAIEETPADKKPTDIKKDGAKNAAISKAKPAVNIERTPADVDFIKLSKEDEMQASVLARSGLFDAGDSQFKRFNMQESDFKEESVIKSRNNYYLKFPVLETEFSFWKKMKDTPPEYDIKPENTNENKQARLLKTLFNKKRYLVFLQTYDWFQNKYPQSQYSEMLAFMKGDAFFNLWNELKDNKFYDQAQNAYKMATEKYPNSVLAERTSLMTGLLANDRTDYMSAIRRFNIHTEDKKYSGKLSRLYAKIAQAYSFSKLKRLDDALNLLSEVQRETKDPAVQTEIAVRKGDFYFYSGKYNEAIAAYDQAVKDHPSVSKKFPSAYFNKMEALFWRNKFKESHRAALDFAQFYPSHEYAPYSLTRVGELLDIMGADQIKSTGAYLETHFRYGDSPKTIVAKLHLLSSRMKFMKPEELDQTIVKMEELTSKSELENIDQFKVAMLSDGYTQRKEYVKAIELLSQFYQSNPTRPDVKQVTNRIVNNISDELKRLSDKADYKNLLKTYRQYADTWLKTDRRIDTNYFLGLAYESAGAYSAALEKYRIVGEDLTKLKGAQKEKEAYVTQHLPQMDSLNLRIAKSNFENASPQEAYMALEKIQKPLDLSDIEQVERVQLASKLYDVKGDHSTSIRYLSELSNLWKGEEKLSLPVLFSLAEKQISNNDTAGAEATYAKAADIVLANKDAKEEDIAKLANSYVKHLVKQNKNPDAIKVLSGLIEKFDKLALSQERYLLGDLLFKNGDIKKAETAWGKIPENKDGIWKKLAQEKLKQASWDANYKKHLKRIPAMSKLEDGK